MSVMAHHGTWLDSSFTWSSSFVAVSYKAGVLTAQLTGPSVAEREATVISTEITRALTEIGSRLRVLVLDLREVQIMSSMGLGMCIDARNSAWQLGAETVIYGLCPQLAELFRMMKVNRLYRIARSEAELIAALAA